MSFSNFWSSSNGRLRVVAFFEGLSFVLVGVTRVARQDQ